MTNEKINQIKEKCEKFGGILKLEDGTKIYCESIEQLKLVLETCKFSDASYVEYPEKEK